jgi:hypothetical protein
MEVTTERHFSIRGKKRSYNTEQNGRNIYKEWMNPAVHYKLLNITLMEEDR